MSLEDWLRNGWLVEHKTGAGEITELLALADRDLADCRVQGLSADWRLNIQCGSPDINGSIGCAWVSGFQRSSSFQSDPESCSHC
jgi:hypothetical protein